jgi:hypothetical protein
MTNAKSSYYTLMVFGTQGAFKIKKASFDKQKTLFLAPTVGLEPTTTRLTAAGSTD